jgi:pimeloyl-ACP methyl ester carboxylesterase
MRRLLQQAGHQVFTPSLTGLGERAHLATPQVNLSTHIQDVVNTIWYEDLTDIILAGYSYGGSVISGVADRLPDRIKHLVYLDAHVLRDGQAIRDLGGGPQTPSPPDVWRVPPPKSPGSDTNPRMAWINERRVAHPKATLYEPLRVSAPLESASFTRTYIVATDRDPDPICDPTAERLRGDPRWTVREMTGGHGMIYTNPEGVAKLLLELFPD